MAQGVSGALGEDSAVVVLVSGKQAQQAQPQQPRQPAAQQRSVMGSRRIFPPAFKVMVLDSYRNDEDCKLNQRATARKFKIHRRQIQKWLQNEKTLRDSCPDAAAAAGHPAQDRRQLQLQPPTEPSPASPALNLSLARLHGDELAAQQPPPPPPQQQQQPPPPPLAQQSIAAQALAAATAAAAAAVAHQQHQQRQQPQPDYRFQVSPTSSAARAAVGYPPDIKADAPIRQPVPHGYAAAAAAAAAPVHQPSISYSPVDRYGPVVYLYRDRAQRPLRPYEVLAEQIPQPEYLVPHRPHHFPMLFEPKAESSSSSTSASPSLHSEDEQQQQQRRASLIRSADIKTERASPDYPATPSPSEAASGALLGRAAPAPSSARPFAAGLKREHPDEEEQCEAALHYGRYLRASSLSSSGGASSPAPSQPDHLESLPLSPDRSSASSDSEMELQPGGAGDLARRRSFSLRFKLEVLDAFHRDEKVAGNQRATARKFNINRRQVQKWLLQESELRGVIEMCGSDSRQRLGPVQEPEDSPAAAAAAAAAVDLRKSLTAELGQASPYAGDLLGAGSPGTYASLTPPYSTPGCSLSCCQEPTVQPYYCYSPGDLEALRRPACTQSCCLPPAKKLCTEEARAPRDEPEQESPLCLVKPKREPAEPAPASKRDAILFKPYLDNPVSKPGPEESANNNCQAACNLNERPCPAGSVELELSFKLPVNYRSPQQQQQPPPPPPPPPSYLDGPPVRSAFVRYPSSFVHYS